MKTIVRRRQNLKETGFGVLPRWQTDIWAALLFLDQTKVAAAKRRLERRPLHGIRYFSAFGCVVALEDAKAAQRQMSRAEREPSPEECEFVHR